MTLKFTTVCFASILHVLMLSGVHAAPVEYTAGHGDIGLAIAGGELELHYHFGDGAVLDGSPLVGEIEYAPDEVAVRLGDATRTTEVAGRSYLGTNIGDSIWRILQSNVTGLPFLGLAAEELDSQIFSSATLQLTSFSGPGEFALWQLGDNGADVFMRTNDGLDTSDVVSLSVGAHDHYNFGFTAAGVYTLGIAATATQIAGGSLTDFGSLTFVVGSATAIPEPGSLALVALTSGCVLLRRRRPVSASRA